MALPGSSSAALPAQREGAPHPEAAWPGLARLTHMHGAQGTVQGHGRPPKGSSLKMSYLVDRSCREKQGISPPQDKQKESRRSRSSSQRLG